jgi:hypothetical protein
MGLDKTKVGDILLAYGRDFNREFLFNFSKYYTEESVNQDND